MNSKKGDIFFSIIVPIYNIEDYIEECVETIEKQDIMDYEIILVDDGSKDRSGKICDELENKYSNICVIHKQNGGLSDARNVGIENANGRYLLFVDGDDYINENILGKIKNKIISTNYPQLLFLECKKVFEKKIIPLGNGIGTEIENLKDGELYTYIGSLPKYPASAWSKVIEKEFIYKNKLFFKKGILSEDLEWSGRLFANMKTAGYLEEDYYFYRQARSGSISNTSSEKKTLDILNTEFELQNLTKNTFDKSKIYMIQSFMEYIFRFLIMGYIHINDKKKYIHELKKIEYVLGTRKDKICKIINFSYKILGIRITAYLLEIYLKIRDN